MKNHFLTLVFSIITCISFSQLISQQSIFSFDITKSILPSLQNVGSTIGIPTTVITGNYVHYPRLTFGYNRLILDKVMLGVDVGFGNKATSFLYQMSEEYSFLEVRPEIQFQLYSDDKIIVYYGLELFHIRNKDVFDNSFYLKSGEGIFNYESASFKREKTGAMLKFGVYRTLFNSFGVNFYTGIGAQVTNIEHSNVMNETENLIEFKHGFKQFKQDGNLVFAEFTLGVKLYFISQK